MVIEINSDNYNEVIKKDKYVVVDFFSTECPPCEALHPKYEFFANLYGDEVKFYKIYRQGNKEFATSIGVSSSPTVIFYKNGEEVGSRLNGAIKKSELKKALIENYNLKDKTEGIERKVYNYDLVIIGAGPAGLTAGLYAGQAKIKTLIIDQALPGGQVNVTHSVSNYPGTGEKINGYMLMHKLTKQVEEANVDFFNASEIFEVDLENKKLIVDDDKIVMAKSIIIATGSKPRKLGVPGEDKYIGKGISYCATCDGKYYEGKNVYVIGGGNSAVEESLFLTKFVNKLTIIHQFDEFQANKMAADEALANPKISVLWSHEPRGFYGNGTFKKLEVENLKTKERYFLEDGDGVFVFIGYVPQTELFKNSRLKYDKWGYIIGNEDMSTDIEGVFVAGDVRSKIYRQITTAVSDGTIASLSAQKYLKNLK